MPSLLITLLSTVLIAFSLYAAHKSYIAITNLHSNEERAEKAAKHFDRAAHELWKTRVTQASGAGSILLSLLSSVYLLLDFPSTKYTLNNPTNSSSPHQTLYTPPIYLPLLNIASTTAAYMHLTNFWKLKPEVPFATGFNEGIRKSNEMRRLLVAMGGMWGVVGVVGMVWG